MTGWVALLGTEELPIAEAPAIAALDGAAEAKVVPLPYKTLTTDEEAHWAGELQGAAGVLLRSGYVTAGLLDRVRAGIDATGLWEELGTEWKVLDAELLPWSAKAMELLKSQYASVGTAAATMLDAAKVELQRAIGRGVEGLDELADRTARRAEHGERYVEAYRRYCWETDGLAGIELAPFQILAAEGEVLARRPHRWHLEMIDRLVEHDSDFFRRTERRFVDLNDEAAVAEATEWWVAATDAGGEGMVVKPADSIVVDDKGLVLPGVKCRGREYLRIIYGPEYLEPENLDRLRERGLSRKTSLAKREFALGIEALDRFVARDHLSATHRCVFGVLALESEPVDPRL